MLFRSLDLPEIPDPDTCYKELLKKGATTVRYELEIEGADSSSIDTGSLLPRYAAAMGVRLELHVTSSEP